MGVPMDIIAKRPFTLFTSFVSSTRHTGEEWTLEELHNAVASQRWFREIAAVRDLAPYKHERDATGKLKSERAQQYSHLKETTLPYAVVSGTWDPLHRHADGGKHQGENCTVNGIRPPSGLKLMDIDDLGRKRRDQIMSALKDGAVPWAAACWLSPGGDGQHLFACLDPAPACQADSYAAYAALMENLHCRLQIASMSSDPPAKNPMRPSFVSCDPDAWLADNPEPFKWLDPPGDTHTGQKKRTESDHTREPWLVQMERVARNLVAFGLDYNAWFRLMGALKSAGMDIDTIESISSEGGHRYVLVLQSRLHLVG